jgi:hypothetical protein
MRTMRRLVAIALVTGLLAWVGWEYLRRAPAVSALEPGDIRMIDVRSEWGVWSPPPRGRPLPTRKLSPRW